MLQGGSVHFSWSTHLLATLSSDVWRIAREDNLSSFIVLLHDAKATFSRAGGNWVCHQ